MRMCISQAFSFTFSCTSAIQNAVSCFAASSLGVFSAEDCSHNPRVQCHGGALSKYLLFMLLVAPSTFGSAVAAAAGGAPRTAVSGKCQRGYRDARFRTAGKAIEHLLEEKKKEKQRGSEKKQARWGRFEMRQTRCKRHPPQEPNYPPSPLRSNANSRLEERRGLTACSPDGDLGIGTQASVEQDGFLGLRGKGEWLDNPFLNAHPAAMCGSLLAESL
ncbi:unnamed protein product [Arctogadus glacialis]